MPDILQLLIFIIAVGAFAAFIYTRVKKNKETRPPSGGGTNDRTQSK